MSLATRINKTEIKIEALALEYVAQVYGLTADELQAAGELRTALQGPGFKPDATVTYLQDMAKAIGETEAERKQAEAEYKRQEEFRLHVHAIWAAVGLTPEQVQQANYAAIEPVNPADVRTIDDLAELDRRVRELCRVALTQTAPVVTAAPAQE